MTNSIAIVLPAPSSEIDHEILFKEWMQDTPYTILYLCSLEKDKILKKDIDLDFTKLDAFNIVCPVGAEALKYVCKLTGVMKYNGVLIENRYIPIINPQMLQYKPQHKDDILKAIKKIKELVHGTQTVTKNIKDYRYIDTEEDFRVFLLEMQKTKKLVIDIETTSLSPLQGEIIGVAFSTKIHQGVFVASHIIKKFKSEIQAILDSDIFIIMHNAKFDTKWLEHEFGWKFDYKKIHDTMLMHYSLDETLGSHGLKALAMKFTDLGDYEAELDTFRKEFCRKHKILLDNFNYGMIPMTILSVYAMKDADGTMQLFEKFFNIVIERFEWVYRELLLKGSFALMQLEINGGPIDREAVIKLLDEYDIDIEECMEDVVNHPAIIEFERIEGKTFNPNSIQQLRKVFFDIIGLTPLKETETGAWSVDKDVLNELAKENELAEVILEIRERSKIRNTYAVNILEGLDKDNRLRSGFNITGTVAGRLSSSGVINYQNIPRDNKDIKKLFKARPGYKIVQGDLATAEVYVAAVLSKDKFLQQAFIEKLDFHSYVAKQVFNIPIPVEEIKKHPIYAAFRQYAKAITFGILFQAGPYTVAEQVNNTKGIKSEDKITKKQAAEFIDKYFTEAKDLYYFIERSNRFIEQNSFIMSQFGRKRRLFESKSPVRHVAQHAIRSGVNFVIQSIASDINLMTLIDAIDWIKENNYQDAILPYTIVHDSIVAEVREDLIPIWCSTIKSFAQKDRGIMIPGCPLGFDLEVGDTWGDLKSYV